VTLKFDAGSFVGISSFEIRVDGLFEANVPPLSSGSCGANCGTKFYAEYSWNPPGPGTYTIAVRAFGNGQFGPAAEIEITIVEYREEDSDSELPDAYMPLPATDPEKQEDEAEPTPPASRP
jgi:hypothetical protein